VAPAPTVQAEFSDISAEAHPMTPNLRLNADVIAGFQCIRHADQHEQAAALRVDLSRSWAILSPILTILRYL
jgi:hypothetical protein